MFLHFHHNLFYRSGAKEYLVSRPELYDLLLRQIPKEKIHMNKKVVSMKQNNEGVAVRCSDNTSYHGDILVGADGAYSVVREQLFKDLKQQNKLPKSDDVPLPFTSVCIVGQTEVLDPEEFPDLNLPHSKFNTILGDNQYSVRNANKRNAVCVPPGMKLRRPNNMQLSFLNVVGQGNHKEKHCVLDSCPVPG